MPAPFVWYDNMTNRSEASTQFLTAMFGWRPQDIAGMTFLTDTGGDMPFAAICPEMQGITGWVPYFEVEDLAAATAQAQAHGAEIIAQNVTGPAGDASFIRDPGGSPLALWTRAPS